MASKLATVLLVEDDETHATLIIRCFESMDVKRICWVSDGEEAMDYLLHSGKYANKEDSPCPDLILLDLRIPKIDGHEVLKEIKNSDELKSIPVVVLTTSKNEHDLRKAYHNHANSYLVKPLGFDKFQQMIKDLGIYWLEWNQKCPLELNK
jgi:CheY-like chemotaxis protein